MSLAQAQAGALPLHPAGAARPRTPVWGEYQVQWLLFVLVPVLFGGVSLGLGQDTNWDLRNYHWYNAYALLEGRLGFDLVPAQTPTFYNPTEDVPLFLAATHLGPRLAGFLLGIAHGLNFVPLYLIARTVLTALPAGKRIAAAAGLALMGLVGAGTVAQIGTSFYDTVVSIGGLAAIAITTTRSPRLESGPWRAAAATAAAAGLCAGAAMGLKLPSVLCCVGVTAGLLALPAPPLRRLGLSFCCGLGVLAGVLLCGGPWMLHLWHAYGNPLFPNFNDLFRSPYAHPLSYRDASFIPAGLLDRLFLPFVFARDSLTVGEARFFDLRIPAAFALVPLALLLRGLWRRAGSVPVSGPGRQVLAVAIIVYLVWVRMFCIYRYLLPLEMLAPIVIVCALDLLPLARPVRLGAAAAVLAVIQITEVPADWGRAPWGRHWIEADIPPIPDPAGTMVLMAGYQPFSHVIPLFPPEIPFVRIESNFVQPQQRDHGYNRLIEARVAAHRGSFLMLSTPDDRDIADEALGWYGLVLDWTGCTIIHANMGEDLSLCRVSRTSGLRPPSP